jgi:hypothetical protein
VNDQSITADMKGRASVSPMQSRQTPGHRIFHHRRHRSLGGFPMAGEDPSRDLCTANQVRGGRPASNQGRAL